MTVRRFKPFLLWLVALTLLLPSLVQAQAGTTGLDPANLDFSVDPGTDFYQFANGGWLARTEIPADKPWVNVFTELDDLTRQQLLAVLAPEGDTPVGPAESDAAKAAALYAQGIDMEARNAAGLDPIQPLLDEIDAIDSVEALNAYQQSAAFKYLTGLFYLYGAADFSDSTMTAAYLSGPWLNLPNRDYYLDEGADLDETRAAYKDILARVFVRLGSDEATAADAAEQLFAHERRLAEVTLTREEQQDFSLSNNPMTLDELAEAYPQMDWPAYLATLGIEGVDTIIVTEPRYLAALGEIVESTPLEVLKNALKVELLATFAPYLDEATGELYFDFTGRLLSGTDVQEPLELRTLDQVSGAMGDAVGQLYVEEYFPPAAKAQITSLMDALIAAFRVRLERNPWMTPETRDLALAKLDAMNVKVGYPDPDKWRSYADVELGETYNDSMLSAFENQVRENMAEIGKPVDRDKWFVPPQVVNAFYDPSQNEIVFPAAILQPPFFDYTGDLATNLGSIGFVIGHELTHGFDLQGAQFDAEGNLSNWWTEEDLARFQALNDKVVAQYDAVEALPGLFVNGQITVTENVADLGGLQIAYDALLQSQPVVGTPVATPAGPGATPFAGLASPVSEVGTPGAGASPVSALGTPGMGASPVAQGPPIAISFETLTPQQRFFIAAATAWRGKTRDAFLETLVRSDPHAPPTVRATLPLQNMDAFYEAFDIGPGDPMYLPPEERVVVW